MANAIETLEAYKPNKKNILRARMGAAFVGDMSVVMPTELTEGGLADAPITLKELPVGMEPIGLVTKDDGFARARDREVSRLSAVGYQDSVRSDVTSDMSTTQIVAMETRKTTIEKFLGVDLSSVTPNADTGELSFPQPNDGLLEQYRWLFIFQDGIGTNRTWWGYSYPAGVISEVDDQSAGTDDDSGFYWPMTIAAEVDTDLGYSVYHYFGGGGWKSRQAAMGFGA